MKPPAYNEFVAACANDIANPPTIHTFLRNKLIADQRLADPNLVTVRYILNKGRSKTRSKMDGTIPIRDNKIRNDAILWRRNAKFATNQCPQGHHWNRRCINECGLLQNVQEITPLDLIRFQDERTALEAEDAAIRLKTRRQTANAAENYTIVDSLLNNQEWKLFEQVMQHLTAAIDNERA